MAFKDWWMTGAQLPSSTLFHWQCVVCLICAQNRFSLAALFCATQSLPTLSCWRDWLKCVPVKKSATQMMDWRPWYLQLRVTCARYVNSVSVCVTCVVEFCALNLVNVLLLNIALLHCLPVMSISALHLLAWFAQYHAAFVCLILLILLPSYEIL